ncbi:SDR family oxidoreductase [Algoriphagus zhangzhouensis]|uniref:NAD(P)-dependent dehydrogenase, short-chain alcohol dehydrogenase family n=1 Tax=Algoriphagus zhangzhouensis TaxID=1073327 RepID=A0A1M7Z3U5_9BACT|nr:SDR family oxidoreductase [Algoriphagus zhangzhouensis]TDY48477.1 NAD(P)-dependent dehydrogenase (short-subunit alcohol dehydrogenase family) [Algoriphagus zhangzhouensis]SHO59525.1 NAD(P)-dependent dehydrogenase, short-chain alcohol dehydrogenase family [Algoriphagus zhangzhouensis]
MSNHLFSLQGKTIAFSGATGVLGESMSLHLAQEGATVLILGRTPAKVDSLVEKIKSEGGKAQGYICDVTDETSLAGAAEAIEKDFGSIDILINAAGGNMPGAVVTPDQNFLDLDTSSLRKVMDLNYMGTVLPIKFLLPLMLKNNRGNILNISSMAATRPMTRVMGYASAKAAIDNLTKWLSVELAGKHGPEFRVNAIAPGFFLTEQNRTLLTESDGSLTKRGNQIITHTPMERFGKPDDLLGALQWLCSDASAFVTGTIVPVDGGFSAYSGV